MEQLIVAAVRGVVQQEEAEVKYQSGFSQLFPPVPQTGDDLVIYGVALEQRIKLHLHTNVPGPDSRQLTCRRRWPKSEIKSGRLWTKSLFHLSSKNAGSPFRFSGVFPSLNVVLTCVKT